ncbi:MAG: class I SAM-dependent methyltransferase [Cytophagales bacterium]|nr:class I SAM-dependent methyltransferase [Cytophagales bacterium]
MSASGQLEDYSNYFSLRGVDSTFYSNYRLPVWLESELKDNKKSKILDFGCGVGQTLGALIRDGFLNVMGVDVSSQAIETALKHQLPVQLISSTEELLRLGDKFDVIIMSHVLEHLPKEIVIPTLKFLKDNILSASGKLILQVPNAQSPTGIYWMYEDFTHNLLFTAGSINYVLNSAGFSNIEFLDPKGESDLNLFKKWRQRFLFFLFEKKTNMWNMATRSQFHKSSPRIYTWELKVKAS